MLRSTNLLKKVLFLFLSATLLLGLSMTPTTHANYQSGKPGVIGALNDAALADLAEPINPQFGVNTEQRVGGPPTAQETFTTNFMIESPTYHVGSIHTQDGWLAFGSAGQGCTTAYDHKVETLPLGNPFGQLALRVSDAYGSGCFGDFTFTKQTTVDAGEPNSTTEGFGHGARRLPHFDASFDFQVIKSSATGLSVVVSDDLGGGSRMNWVQLYLLDQNTLQINFADFEKDIVPGGDFVIKTFKNLDISRDSATKKHNLKTSTTFIQGSDDRVEVFLDGNLIGVGVSWKYYFVLYQPEFYSNFTTPASRAVNRKLIRTSVANPANLGKGFYFDNFVEVASQDKDGDGVVDSVDQCPGSTPLYQTVTIRGKCDTGIKNRESFSNSAGCTLADDVNSLVNNLSGLKTYLQQGKVAGRITSQEEQTLFFAVVNCK